MAKQLRQARAVLRALRDYVRHDLPELVFPSSLPNPPGYVPEPKRSRQEFVALFIRACRRYVDTWDYKKMRQERAQLAAQEAAQQGKQQGGAGAAPRAAAIEDEGPGLTEEFVLAAKGGSQALKPWLANLYQTRALAYKNAVQQFVEGYQLGFKAAMAPEVPDQVAGEMAAAQAQAQAAAQPAEGGSSGGGAGPAAAAVGAEAAGGQGGGVALAPAAVPAAEAAVAGTGSPAGRAAAERGAAAAAAAPRPAAADGPGDAGASAASSTGQALHAHAAEGLPDDPSTRSSAGGSIGGQEGSGIASSTHSGPDPPDVPRGDSSEGLGPAAPGVSASSAATGSSSGAPVAALGHTPPP